MKTIVKKILCISLLIICFSINSNAAQIEIVPSSSVITNVTVSTSYLTCRNLDSVNSTLGTTGLDPHLVTNADWGAVSYLAHSIYGVNATYDDSNKIGRVVTIEGIEFYSTTPNVTGVMNWGKRYTQTASLENTLTSKGDEEAIKSALDSSTDGANTYKNIVLLIKNKDTKYVENLKSNKTAGFAMHEVSGQNDLSLGFSWYGNNIVSPVCIRAKLFYYTVGAGGWEAGNLSTGKASSATFRPAIWNL